MKRFICSIAFFVFSAVAAFSEVVAGTQIVMPPNIFVGEKIQLTYSFTRENFGLSNDENFCTEYAQKIFEDKADSFFLEEAVLEHNGDYHTLRMTLFMWEAGVINFPVMKIGECEIILESVMVNSIVEKTNSSGIKPVAPPLLIPGTTWMIYLGVVIAVILIAFIIFILVKIDAVSAFVEKLSLLSFYRKNERRTIRKLKKLLLPKNEKIGKKEFFEDVQNIMRSYIEKRFKMQFYSITTNEIFSKFEDRLGGNLSENQSKIVNELSDLFSKLDFYRFGQSEEKLGKNEKKSEKLDENIEIYSNIIEESINIVEEFENDSI